MIAKEAVQPVAVEEVASKAVINPEIKVIYYS